MMRMRLFCLATTVASGFNAETDAVTLIGEVGTGTRNCYIKNVVLFEENSILPLPECVEACGVESVWGEVSQESPKNR